MWLQGSRVRPVTSMCIGYISHLSVGDTQRDLIHRIMGNKKKIHRKVPHHIWHIDYNYYFIPKDVAVVCVCVF